MVPPVTLDIADREQAGRHPRHGWAHNSQGAKILWFPLRSILRNPHWLRKQKGIDPTSFIRSEAASFNETLRKLVITMRDLHKLVREASAYPADMTDAFDQLPEAQQQVVLTADHRVFDMMPLHLDASYSYLRRIADQLTLACRPVLFQHWQSAPTELKKLQERVTLGDPSHLKPICDFDMLKEALEEHTTWFSMLRGYENQTKGIRDAMEHRNVTFSIGKVIDADGNPSFVARLRSEAKDVDTWQDLHSGLRIATQNFCAFLTQLHRAIDLNRDFSKGQYNEWYDRLVLEGMDDDTTGYWPEI